MHHRYNHQTNRLPQTAAIGALGSQHSDCSRHLRHRQSSPLSTELDYRAPNHQCHRFGGCFDVIETSALPMPSQHTHGHIIDDACTN